MAKLGGNVNNTSFCGNMGFRNSIINALYGSFPSSVIDIIKWRYEQMRLNLFTPHNLWCPSPYPNAIVLNTRDVLLEIDQSYFASVTCMNNIWQYPNVGHDLPIWLDRPLDNTYPECFCDEFDFTKKKVMIVAQDPLRSSGSAGKITISSVFGMHSKDWRTNRITTQIINELLNNNCCVYLTDYNKLFVDNKKNSPTHVGSFNSKFKSMLDQEICLFKPDLILTWGGLASKVILNSPFSFFPTLLTPYKYIGIKVFPVYHTNYPMSRKYIDGRGYKTKKDLYVQEILKALKKSK